MNKILNHLYAPLFLAAGLRWLFTSASGVEFTDFHYMYPQEVWVDLISAGLAAVCFWHYFVRPRCPNCRGTNVHFLRSQEVDRFVGSKKVTGTDGKGRSTTSHVSTTFVKLDNFYSCPDCNHGWSERVKREHS
jgi:hypothetical protein